MADAVVGQQISKGDADSLIAVDTASRRHRSMVPLLVAVVLIGFGWVFEIHSFLGLVSLRTAKTAAQTPNKEDSQCAELDHRDPGFVRDDTKNLCLSYDELSAQLRDIVFTAAETFQAHNLTFSLESGTLLGSFREKGVIRKDSDVDLDIDAATLKYLQESKVDVPEGYRLTVWNSSLYPGSDRDDKIPVRLIHEATALYADVFAFLDWKNAAIGQEEVGPLPSLCFHSCVKSIRMEKPWVRHFKVPRGWVYPLADCPFEGRTLKCPRETAKYLAFMYGDDFMTPKRR